MKMIILTAAALAAAQPAPAPQAPAGPPAGHADHATHGQMQHGQMQHGQMQHGQNCPCCDHDGGNAGRDCCEHMQQRNHDHRQ
jgi:copper resistance protein B